MTTRSQFANAMSLSIFFDVVLFLLLSLVTGPNFMSISSLVLKLWQISFIYKGLNKNTEIGNTPVWILPNIWRLGWVKNTKLGTNASNTMLLKVAKCQGYSFYCFWVIKGKPTGGIKFPQPRLGLRPKAILAYNTMFEGLKLTIVISKEWQICLKEIIRTAKRIQIQETFWSINILKNRICRLSCS